VKKVREHSYLIAAVLSMWASAILFFLTGRFFAPLPLLTALFIGLTSYQWMREKEWKFDTTICLLTLAGASSLAFGVLVMVWQ